MDDSVAWRLGRRPALDGLRGVAILLVIASHIASGTDQGPHHPLGSVGVTLFFVLSGFLITSLLLEEIEDTGTVDLRAFWIRRARRLFPALAALLVVMGPIMIANGRPWEYLLAPALYVSNWVIISGVDILPLNHTWSLAIEEQFYLVWPLVVLVAWKRLGRVAALGIIASVVASGYLIADGAGFRRLYMGTDVHASSLLLGALVAVGAHRGLPTVRSRLLLYAGTSTLAAAFFVPGLTHPGQEAILVWVGTPVAAATCWVACGTAEPLLSGRVMQYVGRRSYALYLWHHPILFIVWSALPPPLGSFVGVPIAFGVAEVSWRLVESRFVVRRSGGVDREHRATPLSVAG